jgi:hypothetical protein
MLWLLLVGAGLYALSQSNFSAPTGSVSPVQITGFNAVPLGAPSPNYRLASGPTPQPITPWPPAAGQPGYVTIGGKPAPTSYSAGNINTAIQAAGIAGTGVGLTVGLFHAAYEITGEATMTGLGAALPIVGIGVAAVGIVLGIIAKHHAAAVAQEAAALAQATPVLRQRQVLIAQAAVHGEINYSQAVALVQQAISDFYSMVKIIQRGTWKWNPAYNDSSGGFWAKGMDQNSPNAHPPNPCNAACWYGHFAAEGDSYTILLPTIQKILAGKHGTMALPVIPSHAAEAGYPEVDMLY